MTIIKKYLGECPRCLDGSVTMQTLSTNSFCGSIGVHEPPLIKCPNCENLVWMEEINIVSEVDNDDDSHSWWSWVHELEYIKFLKDGQVNGKKLTNTQRQDLEQFIAFQEKLKRQILLDDRAKGCLHGMEYADIGGGTSYMASLVFESLIENKNTGKDKINLDDIGKRYLEWYNKHAIDTGVVNALVFDLVNEGVSFNEASIQVDKKLHGMTASSRPACRALPITIYLAGLINKNPDMWHFSGSDKFFTNFIESETKLTHKNVHARQVSMAVNKVCLCLMLDFSLDESIKEGAHYLISKTRANLGLTHRPKEVTKKDLKNTGYADDAFVAAIWFIRNTDSFDEAVKESIKLKGKSSYCSVLVGAIGGALYGYSDIKHDIGKTGVFKYYQVEYLT